MACTVIQYNGDTGIRNEEAQILTGARSWNTVQQAPTPPQKPDPDGFSLGTGEDMTEDFYSKDMIWLPQWKKENVTRIVTESYNL